MTVCALFLPITLISPTYSCNYHFSSYLAHLPSIVGAFKYNSSIHMQKKVRHIEHEIWCANHRHWSRYARSFAIQSHLTTITSVYHFSSYLTHLPSIEGLLDITVIFDARKDPSYRTWKWVRKASLMMLCALFSFSCSVWRFLFCIEKLLLYLRVPIILD